MRLYCKLYPKAIYKRDLNETLPIHYVVIYCHTEVIEKFINLDPSLISETDRLGNTVRHNICHNGKLRKDLLEKMLLLSSLAPESATVRNNKGQLPVEFALFFYEHTDPRKDEIILMLQRTPKYWLNRIVDQES